VSTPTYSEPPQQRSGLVTALVAGAMIASWQPSSTCSCRWITADGPGQDAGAVQQRVDQPEGRELGNNGGAPEAHRYTEGRTGSGPRPGKRHGKTLSAQAKLESTAHTDALAKQIAQEGPTEADAGCPGKRDRRREAIRHRRQRQDRRCFHDVGGVKTT